MRVGPTNGYLQTNFTQTYFVREQLDRGERPSICNFSSLSLEQHASSLSACCTLSWIAPQHFMKSMEAVVQDCKKDSCKELFSKTLLKSQLRLDNFKIVLKSQLELYFLNSLIRQSSDLF